MSLAWSRRVKKFIFATADGCKARLQFSEQIGELFYISCDELQDLQYMDALIMVLKKLVSMITEKWLFIEKELIAMLDSFLENLPDLWQSCLKRCA